MSKRVEISDELFELLIEKGIRFDSTAGNLEAILAGSKILAMEDGEAKIFLQAADLLWDLESTDED